MAAGYDQDTVRWASEQARLLRTRQFDLLDLEHLADEIEDWGKTEKRELQSRMAVLLAHLLEWQCQNQFRSRSWELTIREQRRQVLLVLDDSPSLRPSLKRPVWIEAVWASARTAAVRETGLDLFPETCPWALDIFVAPDWLPN